MKYKLLLGISIGALLSVLLFLLVFHLVHNNQISDYYTQATDCYDQTFKDYNISFPKESIKNILERKETDKDVSLLNDLETSYGNETMWNIGQGANKCILATNIRIRPIYQIYYLNNQSMSWIQKLNNYVVDFMNRISYLNV